MEAHAVRFGDIGTAPLKNEGPDRYERPGLTPTRKAPLATTQQSYTPRLTVSTRGRE